MIQPALRRLLFHSTKKTIEAIKWRIPVRFGSNSFEIIPDPILEGPANTGKIADLNRSKLLDKRYPKSEPDSSWRCTPRSHGCVDAVFEVFTRTSTMNFRLGLFAKLGRGRIRRGQVSVFQTPPVACPKPEPEKMEKNGSLAEWQHQGHECRWCDSYC